MTPRALLTSIGATAVAFAVAIGVAVGSANGVNTSHLPDNRFAVAASTADDRVSAYAWSEGPSTESERLASWNDPCTIAV